MAHAEAGPSHAVVQTPAAAGSHSRLVASCVLRLTSCFLRLGHVSLLGSVQRTLVSRSRSAAEALVATVAIQPMTVMVSRPWTSQRVRVRGMPMGRSSCASMTWMPTMRLPKVCPVLACATSWEATHALQPMASRSRVSVRSGSSQTRVQATTSGSSTQSSRWAARRRAARRWISCRRPRRQERSRGHRCRRARRGRRRRWWHRGRGSRESLGLVRAELRLRRGER